MGAATAKLFAAAGASVAIADIDEQAGQHTLSTIQQAGGTGCFIPADIADPEQVDAMVQQVIAVYGQLNVAVNNAAILPDTKPLTDLDIDQWDRIMSVNLRGVALCLKFELQHLSSQGLGGSIINVSSVRGFRAKANAAAYVASKHGVVGLTKVAAIEHGHENIRVNCVAPGATDTPMLQKSMKERARTTTTHNNPSPSLMGRLGGAEEVAQASLWLASDQSSFVTGTTIHADGGYTAQ